MKNKEPAQYRAAGGVRYEFKRKRVKNINLRVRADGSVAVSAPLGAPLAQVDAFVAGRARCSGPVGVAAGGRGALMRSGPGCRPSAMQKPLRGCKATCRLRVDQGKLKLR